MKVAVTGPRKGLGQTVTSILLGDMLARRMDGDVNMVDLNTFYTDLDYYLSTTGITRNLDDFVLLKKLGKLSNEKFLEDCTQPVMKGSGLHLTSATTAVDTEMDRNLVKEFIEYNESNFNGMVIDSLSGVNKKGVSRYFLEEADVIVVMLNQNINVIRLLAEQVDYSKYDAKIVFVLNQYVNSSGGVKVSCDLSYVKELLRKYKLDGEVFALPMSLHLMNDSNGKKILNFTNAQMDQTYIKSMNALIDHIFDITDFDVAEEKKRLETQRSLNQSADENAWKRLFRREDG